MFLDDYSVQAEMTATEYAAFFRYSFKGEKSKGIVIHDIDEAKEDGNGRLVGKCRGYYFVLALKL